MIKKTAVLVSVLATAGALSASAYVNSSAAMGKVQLKGYLGDRLGAMIQRHVIDADVDYITAPFKEKTERQGWWQTEFWGKYMHAAMPFLVYTGSETLEKKVDKGIVDMLATQEANGYIGNYPDELRCGEGWDVWGMKYTIMGLIHYYDVKKDAKSLEAARKVCDYIISQIGPNGARGRELWQTGNWCGYASSSVLEPVMWLYNRTQDKRYLDFATFLVKGMTEEKSGPRLLDLALKGIGVADRNGYDNPKFKNEKGGYVMKHNRWKAYEMMSCYQGLIEYARVTGRKDLVDAAIATGVSIIKDEVTLAGGCSYNEAWCHSREKQTEPFVWPQETCVTTTWMRFCETLLEETGDTKWADELEKSFYNIYLASMTLDGKEFAAYTPMSGYRSMGHHHCYMHTDCCTANGPRGFLCFLKKFFEAKKDAAYFNFYSSALVKDVMANGMKVAFDMYSLYPRSNEARIVSHTEGKVAVKFRIPAWSAKTVIKVNGVSVGKVESGKYFTVDREWVLGDVVEIAFDMPVIAHKLNHKIAFTRGPVLLARDSRFQDGDFNEPLKNFWKWPPYKDGEAVEGFECVTSTDPSTIWMEFSAQLRMGAHNENNEGSLKRAVKFCDYASAGNLWRTDNYYQTWLPEERNIVEE